MTSNPQPDAGRNSDAPPTRWRQLASPEPTGKELAALGDAAPAVRQILAEAATITEPVHQLLRHVQRAQPPPPQLAELLPYVGLRLREKPLR